MAAERHAHGDAADLDVLGLVDEAQRAHHFARHDGYKMGCCHVVGIMLLFLGDFLLPDEHFAAQREGGVA
ncbi:hypothetical protein D9M68_819080 [compost metagenome]